MSETFKADPELKYALEVENASFTWDSPPPDEGTEKKGKKKRRSTSKPKPALEPKEVKEETLFKLKQIDFKVPRGQLLAIAGAGGAGKTSFLQGLTVPIPNPHASVRSVE